MKLKRVAFSFFSGLACKEKLFKYFQRNKYGTNWMIQWWIRRIFAESLQQNLRYAGRYSKNARKINISIYCLVIKYSIDKIIRYETLNNSWIGSFLSKEMSIEKGLKSIARCSSSKSVGLLFFLFRPVSIAYYNFWSIFGSLFSRKSFPNTLLEDK